MLLLSTLVAATSLAVLPEQAAAPARPGVSVTIYSSADPQGFDPQQMIGQQRMGMDPMFAWQVPGFGVVRETRQVALNAGINRLPFTDVAAFIDPTTVGFVDLAHPSTAVLEQNFQFDLVSPSKLYERFLGREITLERADGGSVQQLTGELLSVQQGQFVLNTKDGVVVVPAEGTKAVLGSLPDGLITKPTLVWTVRSDVAGERLIRTSYQTAGMTWRADYNLVLNGDDTKADITPWVTLMNVSGAAFRDAQLRLVAGDVQKIRPSPRMPMMRGAMAEAGIAGAADGFEQESLFEYHLYTLPRTTDVLANSTQQLALFPPVAGVPVTKELVFQATPDPFGGTEPFIDPNVFFGVRPEVSVFVSFVNDEQSSLGMPFPRGRARVYKAASDGTLEFVGEDLVDHTPRNNTVRLRLGRAFDITGTRTAKDFSIDQRRRTMSETYVVELKNAKNVEQKVEVRESLYRWSNWEITAKSQDFRKLDARRIAFDAVVPAEGSVTIEYTVKYTW
jgi:hypothetical protein